VTVQPPEVIGVQVPASAANLGPGFDAFAVALGLHLVAWTADVGAQHVTSSGEGARELPTDDRNLVWRGFTAFCEESGVATPEVSIVTRNAIPLERGLGSSAAAAVAGVSLARAVTGVRMPHQELVDLVTAVEGHADNAAAAVMGGLVVCDGVRARRLEPSRSLQPVLCVPAARQSTTASRANLPTSLPVAEAAANGARAALVLAGLSGTMGWEPEVLHDVLHEPARFAAMPATGRLVHRLRGEGFGACLSGSGPTVLVIVPAAEHAAVARITALAGAGWNVVAPGWDRGGTVSCPPSAMLTAP
jgi:homoserine kinase